MTTIRDTILAAEDLQPEPISIPEWNVDAFLRPLDGESRFRIGQLARPAVDDSENICFAEAYICEALVDETGERVFSFDDRKLLAKKDPAVIERLYKRITEISGISDEDEAEAEKNS